MEDIENLLLPFGGNYYYFDFKAIDKFLTPDKSYKPQTMEEGEYKEVIDSEGNSMGKEFITKTYNKGKDIDVSRFELFRMLFEIVLTYDDQLDDTLGADRLLKAAPLPYKMAFNTLIREGLLKEY